MCVLSCLLVSNSLQPHGLLPIRLLCLWDSPGKNTGVGCHFLLQGIFPTQGLNPCLLHLLHRQVDSLPVCHVGSHYSLLTPQIFMEVSVISEDFQLTFYNICPNSKFLINSITTKKPKKQSEDFIHLILLMVL